MNAHLSTRETTALVEAFRPEGVSRTSAAVERMAALMLRVRGEYMEMPGLNLTVPQAARLFGVAPDVAQAVLERLRRASVLTCADRGKYSLKR